MNASDPILQRYVDELRASARMLVDVESAAVAEAWASGALAEWGGLGEPEDRLAGVFEDGSLASRLLTWMIGGAMAAAPDDPAWVADVGTHQVDSAHRLTSSDGAESALVVTYRAASGDRHDVSITMIDGFLEAVGVGPAGVLDAVDDPDFSIDRIDPAVALDRVRDAISADRPATTELSHASEATLPLLARRLGIRAAAPAGPASPRSLGARDHDDDAYAASLVASALRSVRDTGPPARWAAAQHEFWGLVDSGDPDALTLLDVAGVADLSRSEDAFVRAVGAYLAPVSLDAHDADEFDAIAMLEPADWVGAVLGVARAPVGTEIDGETLVSMINRAPEITTTIPARDAPLVAWTFERTLYGWVTTGVLDADGATTVIAPWALARAAQVSWIGADR